MAQKKTKVYVDDSQNADPAAHGAPGRTGEGHRPMRDADFVVRFADAAVSVAGRTVWTGVDVGVRRGEFAAVLGPNGAGKSTMINAILGLVRCRRAACVCSVALPVRRIARSATCRSDAASTARSASGGSISCGSA